mgnify:CR=1 FL=1
MMHQPVVVTEYLIIRDTDSRMWYLSDIDQKVGVAANKWTGNKRRALTCKTGEEAELIIKGYSIRDADVIEWIHNETIVD